MKKFVLFITGFALCLGMAACSNSKNIQCTLKGEVIDRPNDNTLLLSKIHEDSRVTDVVHIPIHDGKFEYVLNCSHEEKYELKFLAEYQSASWRPIYFFSEKGTVHFTFYPEDEHEKNRIEGGALNTEYYTLEKRIMEILNPTFNALDAEQDRLHKEGKYSSAEAEKIYEKLNTADDNERSELYKKLEKLREGRKDITPEAQVVTKKYEDALQLREDMRLQYAKEHPGIVGYSIIVDVAWLAAHSFSTWWFSPDITPAVELYNTVYAQKYPKHPYTEQMKILINSADIKVGGRYIDFEAPDLQGNNVKLSEQIQGKIAVIHLWASWCGPCRQNGKQLIPVYEAYKDKGFTVVGIARERKNIDAMKTAIEKDKYPWLNLVELNDKAQIWTKYGLSNAAGGEFLVDENGVILAISPTAKEVEEILQERLK